MMLRKSQSGFTLIELLVVIAIIGLLASMIVIALANSRAKARDAKRKQDMLNIGKALELYYNTNNSYPCTGNASIGSCSGSIVWYGVPTSGGNCGFAGLTTSGANGYIPNLAPGTIGVLPSDPRPGTGQCAGYNYWSNGSQYKLISNAVGGLGGPESFPSAALNSLYDSVRPSTAWEICVGTTACAQ